MGRDQVAAERVGPHPADLDGAGLRIALVCARFNDHVTVRLWAGARRGLVALGVEEADVTEIWVPGAFEVPLAAKVLAESGRVDAVLGLGCVIRGETTHYESVSGECASGLQRVQLDTGVPAVFGVLTTENLDQALVRSQDPRGHNVGEEAAATAVEMARTLARLRR